MTHTARGVPQRALMRVRRSSNTGMAREKMKTRMPVPTTHDLVCELGLPDTGRGKVTHVHAVQCCHVLAVK